MQDWKFYNVKVEGGCVEEGREGEVSEIRVGRSEGEKAGKHTFPLLCGPECRFEMKAVARKESQERGEEKAVGEVNG